MSWEVVDALPSKAVIFRGRMVLLWEIRSDERTLGIFYEDREQRRGLEKKQQNRLLGDLYAQKEITLQNLF